MTDLQLECMQLGSDNTLSLGCIIMLGGEDTDICTGKCGDTHIFGNNYRTIDKGWISKIIGHPITRGRLCYLYHKREIYKIGGDEFSLLKNTFQSHPELYNQTILEWNEETQLLVRDFLLSIQ